MQNLCIRGKYKIININYKNIKKNYLFTEINQKINEFLTNNNKKIISLGVGDVSLPLDKTLVKIMQDNLNKQTLKKHFVGYPPETGYEFLKTAIKNYYKNRNVNLLNNEIFISNGACCDIGNILDLFSGLTAVIAEPTYPAYYDSNFLQGNKIEFVSATEQNNFCISPQNLKQNNYLIYLCSPNNPTGATLNKEQLKEWVDFANQTSSVIIFDCAYEMFISDDSPHSIYEICGAENCAIEIASFSKMAGFTNIRCGWTIIPQNLIRDNCNLNQMWERRQCTKFNGLPLFIQKGAEYVLSENGLKSCKRKVNYYKQNVKLIKNSLDRAGIQYLKTNNSPYVWLKCPKGYSSWEFFDLLLKKCQVVGIPGVGFGNSGEGYFRLSGFNTRQNTLLACSKIQELYRIL